jgi:hypothetical protein
MLLLAVLVGMTGAAALASPVSAAPRPIMAGSATPGVPTSTTGVMGEHFVRYCVKGYAPNSTVTVTNELTGATVTIHTNRGGRGCAEVPLKRGCHAISQTIVASGTGADGNPASSTAVVTAPPTHSLCAASGSKSGSLAFTGSSIIIPALLIGIVLIMIGTAAVAAARRRTGATRV